jgi:tetratricopeptide (TPR) repeat protein
VEAARKLDPKSVTALVLAGRLARQRGDLVKAVEFLQAAVLQSPGNFAAANHLALTWAAGDADQRRRASELAEISFRTYSDQNTSAGREAAVTYAWLLFQAGRESEAEGLVQAALRAGSISNESAYYAAHLLAQRGKKTLALEILRPTLKLARAFPNRKEAEQLAEKLTKEEPKSGG